MVKTMARHSLDSSALSHQARYKPHFSVNSLSRKNGLQSLFSELERRRRADKAAESPSPSALFVSNTKNSGSSNSKSNKRSTSNNRCTKNNKSNDRKNNNNKTVPIKPWLFAPPKKDRASSFSLFKDLPKDLTLGAQRPPAAVSRSDNDSSEDSESDSSDGSDSSDSTSAGDDGSDGGEDTTENDEDSGSREDSADSEDSEAEDSSGDSQESGSEDNGVQKSEVGIDYDVLDFRRVAGKGRVLELHPWKSCTERRRLSAFSLSSSHPVPKPSKLADALRTTTKPCKPLGGSKLPPKTIANKPVAPSELIKAPKLIEPPPRPIESKLVEPQLFELKPPVTQSHYAPSRLARVKMAARPSLEDEAALFKQIESRHTTKISHDSATRTKLWPEPGATSLEPTSHQRPSPNTRSPSQKHIQDATQRSWELLQKKNVKRQLDPKRIVPSNKRAKFGEFDSKIAADDAPPPTKSHVQKVLPLESTRTITQYTVFKTKRLPLPFDGQLCDKVLRHESFLDKHKANRFAARLMPKAEYVQSAAAITRIEFDFGMSDAERDGMFLGRVYYNQDGKEEIQFVYVDRELQQLGKMSVADLEKEVRNRDLSAEYVQTFLAARYDVFVILRKAIQQDDGRMVVYAYDETEAEIHTREDVDSGDDDGGEEEAEPRQEKEIQPESGDEQITLGSHFEHLLQGSYTTMSDANTKAIDAFEKWTQPPSDRPRLDAIIYYRDHLKPDIAQRRMVTDASGSENAENAEAKKMDVESIELSWEPPPQFGYSYSSISVVVTKSQLEGPLDLTGAFKTG